MGKVYKITKELVNTNTKADPPILDLNGNILSTDEEKLNRWRKHFQSVLNHFVQSVVPPFGDIIQAYIAKHHSVSKYSGIRCTAFLDYADDICLLSHIVLDAANIVSSLENEAASFELKINFGKN